MPPLSPPFQRMRLSPASQTMLSYHLHPLLLLRAPLTSSSSASAAAVGVFWDLDNKPPNSIPAYDAAVRLHLAASSFGPLRLSVAYANPHAFRHLPAPVRAARADRRRLDRLESAAPSPTPYPCRVCGRNFFAHAKLVHHFTQIHEREQQKRVRRIDSARGGRRVRLAAELALKMEKYENAARNLLVPKVGYGLADELRRAGVKVREVVDKPEAADRALREHMVDSMDKAKMGCLVLVSDDSGFAGVLREAHMRCLKTVVIGDETDGVLKRCADVGYLWREVISGKARKEAPSVIGKWKDRELLKRLEWTYNVTESHGEEAEIFEEESEPEDCCFGLVEKKSSKPWWKLDSGSEDSMVASSRSEVED